MPSRPFKKLSPEIHCILAFALLDVAFRSITALFIEAGSVCACTPQSWSITQGVCFARVLHYSDSYQPEARFHITTKYVLLFAAGMAIIWIATASTSVRDYVKRGMPPAAWRLFVACCWMLGIGALTNMSEIMLSGYVTDYIAITLHRDAYGGHGTALNIADLMLACAPALSLGLTIWLLLRSATNWSRQLITRARPQASGD